MPYIVYTDVAVWGYGETTSDARNMMLVSVKRAKLPTEEPVTICGCEPLTCACTDALLAALSEFGGNFSWGILPDGVACTVEEEITAGISVPVCGDVKTSEMETISGTVC